MAKKKPDEIKEEPKPEVAKPEPKVEEKSLPKFQNVGDDIKIRLGKGRDSKWITVKKGEAVEIPRELALRNKLVEVE